MVVWVLKSSFVVWVVRLVEVLGVVGVARGWGIAEELEVVGFVWFVRCRGKLAKSSAVVTLKS